MYCIISAYLIVDSFKTSPDYTQVRKILFISFVSFECGVLVFYILQKVLFPKFILILSRNDPIWFWNVQKLEKEVPGAIRYSHQYELEDNSICFDARNETFTNFQQDPVDGTHYFKCRKGKFSYTGPVNESNMPHGFGIWRAEWSSGEVLSGLFEEGMPVGPFKSREYKTGYSFVNIRVAFVASVSSFSGKSFQHSSLKWGVASVECSVSGKFLSNLPDALLLVDPYNTKRIINELSRVAIIEDLESKEMHGCDDCLKMLIHYEDVAPQSDKPGCHLAIISSKSGLSVSGFQPSAGTDPTEIVIKTSSGNNGFPIIDIPGWIKEELQNTAVIYIPGFNCSTERACEALGQMLALLNPLSNLKPIVFNWPSGKLLSFNTARKIAISDQTMQDFKIILKTVLSKFLKIHILTHSMGARVINSFSGFLESVLQPGTDRLTGVTLLNPEASFHKFCKSQFVNLRKFTNNITIYSNKRDIALFASEVLGSKQLGKHPFDLKLPSQDIWLDLDVVDTTDLDTNVQLAKHSYFSLNRLCVDDIGELMQFGKRASDRSKLVLIEGNVYRFLAAPSYVVTA